MSVQFNRDGTVLFVSDADPGVTQVQASGQTSTQINAAYVTFQNTWPLAFLKSQKQAVLDTLFDANFDLAKFIRGGTSTTVSAAGVGTFLATITNNYRTLRASISAAADVTTLNAINLNSGWPANP